MALKKDLIKELVEKYGYEEKEIKDLTNAKLTSLIKKEEQEALEIKKQEKKEAVKAKSNEIDRNELIEVMNGTVGGLKIGSRTGLTWEFSEYGQIDYIEYHELESIRNRNPKVFTDGILIILNEDIIKKFRLGEVYKNIITPQNAEQIFKKSVDEIEEFIKKVPRGMLQTFVAKAVELYKEDKLNNIRLIKFIEEKFNIDFEDIV